MKIGIPKEIKNNENRVGMTPAGVAEFIRHGHEVMVQHTAGVNSGFADEAYEKVGARILPDIQSVYREAEMIVKVKEPIAEEYPLIHQDQLVFTYFHFACDKELTDAMLKSGAVCLAYETVETDNHHLPLLIPMSEVAGRMAIVNGAFYLQKTKGGKGKLMSGVPGVNRVKVLVLGGGTVGEAAARMAAGMGADVWITDISLPRLRQLEMELPVNVHTLYSNEHNIRRELHDVDIVVGSVLVPGDVYHVANRRNKIHFISYNKIFRIHTNKRNVQIFATKVFACSFKHFRAEIGSDYIIAHFFEPHGNKTASTAAIDAFFAISDISGNFFCPGVIVDILHKFIVTRRQIFVHNHFFFLLFFLSFSCASSYSRISASISLSAFARSSSVSFLILSFSSDKRCKSALE